MDIARAKNVKAPSLVRKYKAAHYYNLMRHELQVDDQCTLQVAAERARALISFRFPKQTPPKVNSILKAYRRTEVKLNDSQSLYKRKNESLGYDERAAFVAIARAYALSGSPLTVARAKQLLCSLAGKDAGWHSRHVLLNHIVTEFRSLIRVSDAQLLSPSRIQRSTLSYVENLALEIQGAKQQFALEHEVNVDECLIRVHGTKGKYVVEAERRKVDNTGKRYTTAGAFVPFVTAAGKYICGFWVLKEDRNGEVDLVTLRERGKLRDEFPNTFFMQSPSGYVRAEHWEWMMEKFALCWREQMGDVDCRLWCDNLSAHHNAEVMPDALLKGIHVWFLVRNCSHFMQPLDCGVFAAFKKALSDLAKEVRFAVNINLYDTAEFQAPILFEMAMEAERMVMHDEKMIRDAWLSTMLVTAGGDQKFKKVRFMRRAETKLKVLSALEATLDRAVDFTFEEEEVRLIKIVHAAEAGAMKVLKELEVKTRRLMVNVADKPVKGGVCWGRVHSARTST